MDRKAFTTKRIVASTNRYITYKPKNANIIPSIITSSIL